MKPILFNTEMVRAILDGRKTATRRVLKGKWRHNIELDVDGSMIGVYDRYEGCVRSINDYAPYQIGDILYVRETWAVVAGRVGDWKNCEFAYRVDNDWFVPQWRPSIHMPKEAARIFLCVTDVRVERLRDIGDCTKEGVARGTHATAHMNAYDERCDFKALWNSTIKESDLDRYGWDANPWVWVIEFERISKEEAYES